MSTLRILMTCTVCLLGSAAVATAATYPSGFSEEIVATGLSSPTAMAFAPDGRLFVAEQGGQLRVVKNDTLLGTPFFTLPVDATNERGLLGIAFDPQFLVNRFVYVYYTATSPTIHNRVSRLLANGDVAFPGSEVALVDLETLSASNHNGGVLHFGPDGRLYIGVGENANGANAQTLTNRLGKMLRIASDGSIPSDNPFYATASGANRSIWALGLRNPFSFAFQGSTGRMFINDVGQSTWEEIDDGVAGSNYGWPATEGVTTNPAYRSPLYVYDHSGGACAITGGAFYDDATGTYPVAYKGKYFFADFCAGWINRFDPGTGVATAFASGVSNPVDLTSGPEGNLYVLARGAGNVLRVTSCTGTPPALSAVTPTAGPVGSLALATVTGAQTGVRLEFGVMPSAAQSTLGGFMAPVPQLPVGAVSVRAVNTNGCRSNALSFTVTAATSCGLLGIEPLVAIAGARLLLRRRRDRAGLSPRCPA